MSGQEFALAFQQEQTGLMAGSAATQHTKGLTAQMWLSWYLLSADQVVIEGITQHEVFLVRGAVSHLSSPATS